MERTPLKGWSAGKSAEAQAAQCDYSWKIEQRSDRGMTPSRCQMTHKNLQELCSDDVRKMLIIWPKEIVLEESADGHEHSEWKAERWIEPAKVVLFKKVTQEWTPKKKNMFFSWVVNEAFTQERQQRMNLVENEECQQCGKEGNEYHRLC